jgi:hypothetical protein
MRCTFSKGVWADSLIISKYTWAMVGISFDEALKDWLFARGNYESRDFLS